MIEEKREALSAMLDDELPGRIFDQLVTDLGQDSDLRKTMTRYRLIGDVMRGDGVTATQGNIAAAVRERLSDEPVILAPQRGRAVANWGKGVAGLAIAASVGLVAVGLVDEQQRTSRQASDPQQLAVVAPQALTNEFAEAVTRQVPAPTRPQPGEKWLTRYLAEHNEFASRGGANGFMSYTTFVAYDGR